MSLKILLLPISFLILILSFYVYEHQNQNQNKYDYLEQNYNIKDLEYSNHIIMSVIPEYDVFALTRCNLNSRFTIHGLWAEWNKTSWPEFCNTSDTLKMENIEDLVSDLNEYWFSCYGTNFYFWNHEWIKHGTCMYANSKKITQHMYFALTLNLYKLNIYWWKKRCDINSLSCLIPSDNLNEIAKDYYYIDERKVAKLKYEKNRYMKYIQEI